MVDHHAPQAQLCIHRLKGTKRSSMDKAGRCQAISKGCFIWAPKTKMGPAIDALRAHVPSIATVGPLLEQDVHGGEITTVAAVEDDDGNGCMAWLDAQPPGSVVYVAFGSLVNIGRCEMKAVAEGLLATGRALLWVVHDDSRGLLPGDVLAACYDNKGNNKIVEWCPQGLVLGHGAVGCFVTHCGWNSVSEALACAVPVIGYPWWSDQFTNAKFWWTSIGSESGCPRR
jgi:gallate 1-beta-glucosyltransferase